MRPDVAQSVSVASVLALLLQRWRAELSCALVRGDAAVFLDALHDTPAAGAWRGPHARGLPHVYDLTSYRLGS